MRYTTQKIGAGLLASALLWGPLVGGQVAATPSAHAAEMKKMQDIPLELEPWPGRRVVLLLPLQLGVGFNADREFGNLILPRAEAELTKALEATGKFSVLHVHRFSPLVQRGLQEKRVTEEQVRSVTAQPVSVDSAMAFLSQYTFDQAPMVADFRLEEVRSSGSAMVASKVQMRGSMSGDNTQEGGMIVDSMMNDGMMSKPLMMGAGTAKVTQVKPVKGNKIIPGAPSVQAQVSGRLYQAGEAIAYKAPVVTSMSVQTGRNNIERYLIAANDAFERIAAEFTAPLEDVVLPQAPLVPATPTENATTSIGAVTSPDSDASAPIVAPTPANPAQGNPIPPNQPAVAN